MAALRFHPEDNVTVRCDVCGVESVERLEGEYDPAVVDAALDRGQKWIEAHLLQFHPEHLPEVDR